MGPIWALPSRPIRLLNHGWPVRGSSPAGRGTPISGAERTWICVKMFWYVAMVKAFQLQIGSSSHQFHHSGQPRDQKGPEMMMHTADQKPALSARNSPSR